MMAIRSRRASRGVKREGVRGFRSSGVQKFRSSGVQKFSTVRRFNHEPLNPLNP
jgi:hypothetical protein